MKNEYEKYLDIVKKKKCKIGEEKVNNINCTINKLAEKGSIVIINSYHFSNLVGIKWKYLKSLINNPEKYYYNFEISKKNGGKRKISVPNRPLELCQKYIKENILDKINIHNSANGFASNKSIITNALYHVNKEVILNIDLKDFFPSIDSKKVFYVFNSMCGYDKDLSHCLTKLVLYDGGLPQGACTSPILSNIVSYKMDVRLKKLADSKGITYTRYADDITFSGDRTVVNDGLLKIVTLIVEDCGYRLNESKTRFQSNKARQEVTGLIVNNGKISVSKRYLRKIRQELYYIKKYGILNHKQKSNIYNRYYKEHLKGKIMFIYSVDKECGIKYLKMYNEIFDK